MQYIQTGQDAELNAAQRMRELGFADAQVTAGGADCGIDVHSSTALAQVKWRGGMAGRPELQALFGARGSDFSKQLLFFAASDYSQHAVEYAEHYRIALFVYDPTGTLAPKNQHAALLLNRGHFNFVGRSPQSALSPWILGRVGGGRYLGPLCVEIRQPGILRATEQLLGAATVQKTTDELPQFIRERRASGPTKRSKSTNTSSSSSSAATIPRSAIALESSGYTPPRNSSPCR